jgi:hypothetical protein
MHEHVVADSWAGNQQGEDVVQGARGEDARAVAVDYKRREKGQILNEADCSACLSGRCRQ